MVTQRVPAWVLLVAVLATIVACVTIFLVWRFVRMPLRRSTDEPRREAPAQPAPPTPTPLKPATALHPATSTAPGGDSPGRVGPANVSLGTTHRVVHGRPSGNAPLAVRRTLEHSNGMVLACLRQAAQDAAGGTLPGVSTFDLRFTVAPTGRAVDVSVVGLDAARFVPCVAEGLSQRTFAVSGRGATYVSTWVVTW